MNEIHFCSEKQCLVVTHAELWFALQDMVFKLDQPVGNKQKASVWSMSLFCLAHLLCVWLNDTTNKVKPDVACYGRPGALGFAGQGAKGNGI